MDCAYFVLFFLSCSESYLGGHFFTCQKYFASAIFAQGTPLLYSACSFKHYIRTTCTRIDQLSIPTHAVISHSLSYSLLAFKHRYACQFYSRTLALVAHIVQRLYNSLSRFKRLPQDLSKSPLVSSVSK